jgi:hypothetical protein
MPRESKTAGNPANADKIDMWRPQAVCFFIFNARGGSIPQKEGSTMGKVAWNPGGFSGIIFESGHRFATSYCQLKSDRISRPLA